MKVCDKCGAPPLQCNHSGDWDYRLIDQAEYEFIWFCTTIGVVVCFLLIVFLVTHFHHPAPVVRV